MGLSYLVYETKKKRLNKIPVYKCLYLNENIDLKLITK